MKSLHKNALWVVVKATCLALGCVACAPPPQASPGAAARPSASAERKNVSYKTVAATSWTLSDEQIVEAKLEKADKALADLPAAAPYARLIITNLSSGKVIFEKGADDFPSSVSKADFVLKGKDVLIVTWAAGSAEGLEVYTVSADSAEEVLSDSFMDAYVLLLSPAGGEKTEILTIDKSAESSRLEVRRFVWKNGKYEHAGSGDYEKFAEALSSSLK